MAAAPQHDERRHLQRFPAAELKVRLRTGRGWVRKGDRVPAHDFTRAGMGVTTTKVLKPGQKVELDLVLKLDRGEIVQERVVATVHNKRTDGNLFRYGLAFDFTASRRMKSLHTQARLGRMEGILDRIEKLRAKTRSGEELMASHQQPDHSGS